MPSRLMHAPHRYAADLSLKVPPLLWLLLAFLLRHAIILIITYLPTTGQEITVLRELIRPEFLLADAIAMPVFIAAIRRQPRVPRWLRGIWTRARAILSLAILVYLGLLTGGLMLHAGPLALRLSEVVLGSALINLAALAYLWRSRLLADLFRDWPVEPVTARAFPLT